MSLNKKYIGFGLLPIGVILLIAGILTVLSMPIVGVSIMGLGIFSMIGGVILIRQSKIVVSQPVNPDLERSEETSVYTSSFVPQAAPQQMDSQKEFMLHLNTGILSEDELCGGVKNLLIPSLAEKTKYAIVKAIFEQMKLLLEDCKRKDIKKEALASNIKKLDLLRGILKNDSYKSIPAILHASAHNICNAVKKLLNSNEYSEAMTQADEADEKTGLLEGAKSILSAVHKMQTLLRSPSFIEVEETVKGGIKTRAQTIQEEQCASDLSSQDETSQKVLGFY